MKYKSYQDDKSTKFNFALEQVKKITMHDVYKISKPYNPIKRVVENIL